MVTIRKRTAPVDYRLCMQTVTVYHKEGDEITRTVYPKAFLDFTKVWSTDKTGSKEVNNFLLVIPGPAELAPEDKVMLGQGPEVKTAEEWRAFIPSRIPGLVVVKTVDPKHWGGKIAHIEAGG